MKLPASVRVSGIPSEFATTTGNVSSRGIFFHLDRLMTEGARIEVTLTFPSEVTFADPLLVRCAARVLRVEPVTPTRAGVAAMIHEYEFLRSENASQASPGMEPGWHSAP